MTRRWRCLCRGDNVLGALARSPAPPRPRRPLSRSPSSPPLRYEGASPGLAEAGAGSLCSRASVKREARAGSGAARGARGPARVPGERGLRAPRTRRGRLAPAGLGRRLNSVRGPPFPLRGIPGHDSRSPSLSCFPSLPLIVWGESSLGGPECPGGRRKVPQRVAGLRAERPGSVPGRGRRRTR